MKRSLQNRKHVSDRIGLLHEENLLREDLPIESRLMSSDHGIQLTKPQERRLPTLVMQVKAQMEE